MNIICLDKKISYIKEYNINNINEKIDFNKEKFKLYKSISTQTSDKNLIENIYNEKDDEIPYESYEKVALNLIENN